MIPCFLPKKIDLLLLIVALILLSLNSIHAQKLETGIVQGKTKSNAIEIAWAAYIPEDYNPEIPHPVLFRVHGMGGNGTNTIQSASQFGEDYQMIIIQPTYTGVVGQNWASHPDCLHSVYPIIEEFTSKYNIDTDRVFISGFSAGGAFIHSFLAAHKQPKPGQKPFRIIGVLGTSPSYMGANGLAGEIHYFYDGGELEMNFFMGAYQAWQFHHRANKKNKWIGRLYLIPNMDHTINIAVRSLMVKFINDVLKKEYPNLKNGFDKNYSYQKSTSKYIKQIQEGKIGKVLKKAFKESEKKGKGDKFDPDLVYIAETVGKTAKKKFEKFKKIQPPEYHQHFSDLEQFIFQTQGCIIGKETKTLKKQWLKRKELKLKLKAPLILKIGFDFLASGKKEKAAQKFQEYLKRMPEDEEKEYLLVLIKWCKS